MPTQRKVLSFHWQILIALVVGSGLGLVCHSALDDPQTIVKAGNFVANLFVRALQMLVVPLIFSSLVASIVGLKRDGSLATMSRLTLVFYLTTSLIAVFTGLFVVNAIGPGKGVEFDSLFTGDATRDLPTTTGWDAVLGIATRAIPENIFAAASSNRSILAVIFFAVLLGVFSRRVSTEHTATLKKFYDAMFAVFMEMTMFVIKFAPVGVGAAMLGVAASGKLSSFGSLWLYLVTVFAGLAFHGAVALPMLLRIFGGRSPVAYAKSMAPALMTAFSTASSNATLPLTMSSAGEAGVSEQTRSFTLPLGATINMDGTALYEVVAVLFVAQTLGDLSLGQQVVVAITALAASIGAAGIPSAGLVMMVTVFEAVGMGERAILVIPVILGIDRVLDMGRTTVNVWSDSVCAAVVDHRIKSENE